MDAIQQLLLLSQKLFDTLETFAEDKDEQREKQIALIDKLLDARGQTIDLLLKASEHPIKGHKDEVLLKALNKGILERLEVCKTEILSDMKQLQTSKKSESRYMNPYSSLQNRDGTYFDGRK
ncbi:MAG: flagellar protein FliT [Kurthia sp.]|nr:flagellar protein FliT [Candidatus Kurthia equi]